MLVDGFNSPSPSKALPASTLINPSAPSHHSTGPTSSLVHPASPLSHGRPTPVLVIHGGASGGTLPPDIPPSLEAAYRSALALSLQRGYAILNAGGSALDAVTEAVKSMEDDELFNSGHGAVLNLKGEIECEASIMCSEPLPGSASWQEPGARGEKSIARSSDPKVDLPATDVNVDLSTHFPSPHRRYAAATLIRDTKNPITLARALYLHPSVAPHAFFSGREAEEIGWSLGTERVVGKEYYWTRRRWEEHRKALGLPIDVDPASCCDSASPFPQDSELHTPGAPPPTYDSLARTGQTQSSRPAAFSLNDTSSIHALPGSDIGQASVSERDGYAESRSPTTTRASLDDEGVSRRTSLDVQASGMSSSSSSSRTDDEKSSQGATDGNEADVDSRTSLDSSFRRSSPPPSNGKRRFMPMGTVGAVALDIHGRVASATSTGGITNKLPGRIGDTPSVGAGFWAETWDAKEVVGGCEARSEGGWEGEEGEEDEDQGRPNGCGDAFRRAFKALFGIELGARGAEGGKAGEKKKGELNRLEAGDLRPSTSENTLIDAPLSANVLHHPRHHPHPHPHPRPGSRPRPRALALSATGTGDVFLRLSFASLVSHRRKLLGESLDKAVKQAVKELGELEGEGGCVAVGEGGEVVMRCNTSAMNRGFISNRTGGKPHVAIWAKEDCRPWTPPSPGHPSPPGHPSHPPPPAHPAPPAPPSRPVHPAPPPSPPHLPPRPAGLTSTSTSTSAQQQRRRMPAYLPCAM